MPRVKTACLGLAYPSSPARCGGEGLGLGFARRFGRFGFIGGRARWLSGLGGQEQDCQEGPYRGNASDDEGADGEAAQEGIGGRVMQRLAEGRMPRAAILPTATYAAPTDW